MLYYVTYVGYGQWGHWPDPICMLCTGDRIFLLTHMFLYMPDTNETTVYVTFLAPDGSLVRESLHVSGKCNSLEQSGYVTQTFVEPPS